MKKIMKLTRHRTPVTIFVRYQEQVNKSWRKNMSYIVWIGGIDDHYQTKGEAEQAVKEWQSKGYDDIIIEEITGESTQSTKG